MRKTLKGNMPLQVAWPAWLEPSGQGSSGVSGQVRASSQRPQGAPRRYWAEVHAIRLTTGLRCLLG